MSCLYLDNFFNGIKNDPSELSISYKNLKLSGEHLNGVQGIQSREDVEGIQSRESEKIETSSTSSEDNLKEVKYPPQRVSLEDEIINRFVDHLINLDIHLVCFDFDMTIVDPIYTPEFFNAENIMARITPLFYKLGMVLLNNAIDIAIVTFNMNQEIESAVSQMFQYPVKVYARQDHELFTGKGWHLDGAMRAFNKRMNISDKDGLRPTNVLFVDDDRVNIEIATRAGYNCINNRHVISLDDLVKFIESNDNDYL